MREIDWTGQFKRDYKREGKGQHRLTLDEELFAVIEDLAMTWRWRQSFVTMHSRVSGKTTGIATSNRIWY